MVLSEAGGLMSPPLLARMWEVRPVRLLLSVAAVVAAVTVIGVMAASLSSEPPPGRAALRLASPLPPGDKYAEINRVSQWPTDWTNAVCVPPLYQLITPYSRLPHATEGAVCEARMQPNGEVVDLTIARFPAELPMQVDLHNDGYEWYAFAFDHGEMLVFATFSDVEVTDPVTNLVESAVLQPLKRFGFVIYHDPGP